MGRLSSPGRRDRSLATAFGGLLAALDVRLSACSGFQLPRSVPRGASVGGFTASEPLFCFQDKPRERGWRASETANILKTREIKFWFCGD
jgi:hypothetical protein